METESATTRERIPPERRPADAVIPGEQHLPFVVTIAREYRNLGIPTEDLVAEGYVGLLEAARRYDPTRGTKFPTYAAWWIRKRVLSALSERVRIVRVPPDQWKRAQRLRDAERSLNDRLGRPPDREELAREAGLRPAEIDRISQWSVRELRLDQPYGDEDAARLLERLADPSARNPEREMLRREWRHRVVEEIRALSDRERSVLRQRFGLDGRPSRSLEQIGQGLGVSRERIRQIESHAIATLRRRMGSRYRQDA